MNKDKQIDLFDSFVAVQNKILLSKGDDYSGEDRLSNFKEVAMMIGCPVEMVARVLIGVKIARLKQLMSYGKIANHESVNDTILDLANYTFLLHCILNEQDENATPMPLEIKFGIEAEELMDVLNEMTKKIGNLKEQLVVIKRNPQTEEPLEKNRL